VRGASTAWREEAPLGEYAKSDLRDRILNIMDERRERASRTSTTVDELALLVREEVAAAMVRGDFAAAGQLNEALHEVAQLLADSTR